MNTIAEINRHENSVATRHQAEVARLRGVMQAAIDLLRETQPAYCSREWEAMRRLEQAL